MISGITGRILRTGLQTVYIDTGTIEYEVYVPLSVFEFLKNQTRNKKTKLFIYHYYQADEEKLFGFLEFSHRELFRTLLKLKGIGPSLALSILSHLDTKGLLEICENKDIKSLEKIPRIGKNIAEEIIFEVNRKKKEFLKLIDGQPSNQLKKLYVIEDAVQGLIHLGYKEKIIRQTIEKIKATRSIYPENTAQWIREVLKEL